MNRVTSKVRYRNGNAGTIRPLWMALSSPLLFLASCAKVGAPLPPAARPQEVIRDLQLIQVADRVELEFSLPEGEIRSVEVLRGCGAEEEVVGEVERDSLQRTSRPDRFVFRDRPPRSETPCRYRLRTVGENGSRSEVSRPVMASAKVALPPTDLVAEVLEDRIVIRWQPPPSDPDGHRGFLVNGSFRVQPAEFVDRDFQFGRHQTYRVQTVSQDEPLILSDFSPTLNVLPEDTFAPAVPRNLSAVRLPESVQLIWDPNDESDLQGYFVYRGRPQDPKKRLSPLIRTNSYRDRMEGNQEKQYYRVSAIDSTGNESDLSSPAAVAAP